jgi:hypothetical protein
MISFRGSFV